MNNNVAQISSLTQGSSLAAEQTAKACAELSTMALDLQNLVSQFKLGGFRSIGSSHAEVMRSSNLEQRRPAKAQVAAAGR